jgi:hypothetical protein
VAGGVTAARSHLGGRNSANGTMAVLGAFFDDSGTHERAPVVALGGLLGTDEQWDAFAEAWAALLEHPLPGKPKLHQFHLAPCRARDGEFRDYNWGEIDRVTYLFRRIILDIGFVTVAAAVNKTAWDELVVGDVAPQVGTPIQFCLHKCFESVLKIIRWRKPWERAIVVIDQGTKPSLEMWVQMLRLLPEQHPEITSIFFAPVSKVIALQGADMIATETYHYAQAWMKNRDEPVPNPHFREFIDRDLSSGLIFDREHIEEMVNRVRTFPGGAG